MLFYLINPYVRYAREQTSYPYTGSQMAYENRIFCCAKGSGYIIIDNVEYEIKKGTFVFWRAGVEYRFCPDKSSPMSLTGCNFDFTSNFRHISTPISPDRPDNFDKNNIIENVYFEDVKRFNNTIYIQDAYSSLNKLFEINMEFANRKLFFEQRCSALMSDVLSLTARITENAQSAKSNEIIDAILSYIQANYSHKLTNTILGEKFNYHPNYINRLMVQYTGMSLHHYLINHRITTAIHLLQSTNMPVTAIAELVGFLDLKHFSKCFKNMTNKPPSAYRIK